MLTGLRGRRNGSKRLLLANIKLDASKVTLAGLILTEVETIFPGRKRSKIEGSSSRVWHASNSTGWFAGNSTG
jgi:hypothetical protein